MTEGGKRRLAAIVIADVVGYSRLVGADEIGALAALRAHRGELIDPLVARHGGRIVKTMGDGLLLEFASVVAAVQCSIEVQEGMSRRNAGVADDRRIAFRIGINLGDIIIEGDDIFGDGVNVAARLEALAEPGGLLVSQTVHDSAAGKLDAVFLDNGEREFKNIAKPIGVWSWPDRLSDKARDDKPLVLVSEFECRREDEKELADGIREDLAISLSRLTGLQVTVDRDKAQYLVRGGVRQVGKRCRVSAQLIAVEADKQLWAERYDEELLDSFEVQDRCVHRIAMSVRRRVAADDAGKLAGKDMENMSIEEILSLSGVTFFTPTKAAWSRGGEIAELALQRDSKNFMALAMALAMAAAGGGLAEILFGFREPDDHAIETAFRRIEEARRLTDKSDLVLVVYSGLLLYARRRHQEAAAAVERALQLNFDFNMGPWARPRYSPAIMRTASTPQPGR
jgi:adenylate cyclase